MSINANIKEKAIELRKNGKSYSEILEVVPVAKSTLSLWLGGVGLTVAQKQRLTEKRLSAVKRGGLAKNTQRLARTKKIQEKAIGDIGKISKKDLFLIGTMLYWAEGSKQKPHNPSERVMFSNSDPKMLSVFIKWLDSIDVPRAEISFSIYLHDTAAHRINEIQEYWSKTLKLSINKFEKIYFKPSSGKSFRKNMGVGYYGQIRVVVARSTNLNRKIEGWVLGIIKNLA